MTMTVLFSLTACGKKSDSDEPEISLDMEQAARDLDAYCTGPVALRMDSTEYPEQNKVGDFTGDGYDDLITSYTFGSGIVRTVVVVYDVANQVFYRIGDERDSYFIKSFEDGILTVEQYTYPDSYVTGTLELSDDGLVFVPGNGNR